MSDNEAPVDTEPAAPNETPVESAESDAAQPVEDKTDWKSEARKWEARSKENAAAAKKLREIEDRDLSELQKAQRDRDEVSAELTALRRTTLVQQVAIDKGLSAALAARLQGDTAEDLAADADALLTLMGTQRNRPAPDPGQGNRTRTPDQEFDAEYAKYYPSK